MIRFELLKDVWDSFGHFIDHLKFVHDHHRKIDRVAAVTDAAFLKIAALTIAQHFAHPEIRVFASGERGEGARMVASLMLSEARPSCRTRHRHCRHVTSGAY